MGIPKAATAVKAHVNRMGVKLASTGTSLGMYVGAAGVDNGAAQTITNVVGSGLFTHGVSTFVPPKQATLVGRVGTALVGVAGAVGGFWMQKQTGGVAHALAVPEMLYSTLVSIKQVTTDRRVPGAAPESSVANAAVEKP